MRVADPWSIPATHDPVTREVLAHWKVLQKAGRFAWDADRGTSWWQLPATPEYAGSRAALADAGLDPDAAARMEHDTALRLLRERAGSWTRSAAAAAFVAGLGSAPAAWRSALPGALLAEVVPEHPHTPWGDESPTPCEVCGFQDQPVQLIQEWAFRLTEGTPLDGDPVGYALVLESLGDARPEPTEHDRWALGAILAVLRTLPAKVRYAAAAKAVSSARILRGPRTAASVLEDLALVGVLAPPDRPGLAERFTTYRERYQRPTVRVEVQSPLAWWDTGVGSHGVRVEVFEELFGTLGIPVVDLDAPRPSPRPAAKDTIDGGLAARVRTLAPTQRKVAASVGEGPAAAGDVWAIRLEPWHWVAVYVHEVSDERQRPYAHAEFLDGVQPEMPAAGDISMEVRPGPWGRAADWVHSLESTPWVRRIAQGVAAPQGDGPRPDDGSWEAAKELRTLSGWHFGD
ncbi:hypothetical protein [Clavibacter tessellarius]|uniref:hypothetical protein n=1 Tax=Clavibacter tessellarius TaxID=31965 RepID=UPI00324AA30B